MDPSFIDKSVPRVREGRVHTVPPAWSRGPQLLCRPPSDQQVAQLSRRGWTAVPPIQGGNCGMQGVSDGDVRVLSLEEQGVESPSQGD